MSHQDVLQLLAILLLICIAIIFVIDICTELGLAFAIRVKWTLVWYFTRYIAITCAILLALDVLSGSGKN